MDNRELESYLTLQDGRGCLELSDTDLGSSSLIDIAMSLEIMLIWVDRLRLLSAKSDVFKAFDVALRWYWDCHLSWDTLEDVLQDEWYLPQNGCLLYFDNLGALQTFEPGEFATLVDILAEASKFHRQRGYLLKSLYRLPKET